MSREAGEDEDFAKIGHSKGLKLAILAPFVADVLTSNLGPIRITLGMAGLPGRLPVFEIGFDR